MDEHIRSDNGAEMTAKVVRNWLTQVVNGNKGIHVMLDKRYLTRG